MRDVVGHMTSYAVILVIDVRRIIGRDVEANRQTAAITAYRIRFFDCRAQGALASGVGADAITLVGVIPIGSRIHDEAGRAIARAGQVNVERVFV